MPEKTSFLRERIVLETISDNPDLHHNALIKLIVPEHMAKTTFEKTRDGLVDNNILIISNEGNKKIYKIPDDYSKKSLQLIERVTIEKLHGIIHQTKNFEDNFSHKDVSEKISSSIQLLSNLLQTDNGFTILDSVKNPKKTLYKDEHLLIQEMISKIIKLILNDQDSKIIFSVVMTGISGNFSNTLENL